MFWCTGLLIQLSRSELVGAMPERIGYYFENQIAENLSTSTHGDFGVPIERTELKASPFPSLKTKLFIILFFAIFLG